MNDHGMAPPIDVVRYRVERELGRGGMAVVYLAHDLKHDRPVARAEPGPRPYYVVPFVEPL